MDFLTIGLIIFLIFEGVNTLVLLFLPDFKIGNGMGVFDGYFKAKKDENLKLYTRVVSLWLALIKIGLFLVTIAVIISNNEIAKVIATGSIIFILALFFITINPILLKLDKLDQLTPRGYSKAAIIQVVILIFILALSILLQFTIK